MMTMIGHQVDATFSCAVHFSSYRNLLTPTFLNKCIVVYFKGFQVMYISVNSSWHVNCSTVETDFFPMLK